MHSQSWESDENRTQTHVNPMPKRPTLDTNSKPKSPHQKPDAERWAALCSKPTGRPLSDWMVDPGLLPKRPPNADSRLREGKPHRTGR